MIWIYTVCKDTAYPGSAGLGLICSRRQITRKLNKAKGLYVRFVNDSDSPAFTHR